MTEADLNALADAARQARSRHHLETLQRAADSEPLDALADAARQARRDPGRERRGAEPGGWFFFFWGW